MAKPQPVAQQENNAAGYEHELAGYLQKRIKPNLNSGAIPLLARSIAKEIAHQEQPANGSKAASADDQSKAESDDKSAAGSAEQPKAESDDKSQPGAGEQAKATSDDKPQ